MGQSTDALLAFGIDFGEKDDFPWNDGKWENEFDAWWADQLGTPPPTEEYSDKTASVFTAYWEKKKQLKKECPVELVPHCHAEATMYVLASRGTVQSASRGSPEEAKMPVVDPSTVLKFCKDYGIEVPTEPKWLLFSYWC